MANIMSVLAVSAMESIIHLLAPENARLNWRNLIPASAFKRQSLELLRARAGLTQPQCSVGIVTNARPWLSGAGPLPAGRGAEAVATVHP